MASKKKWFGLAALASAVAAFVLRRKREQPKATTTEGSIET